MQSKNKGRTILVIAMGVVVLLVVLGGVARYFMIHIFLSGTNGAAFISGL